MRAVIQRVSKASVSIHLKKRAQINRGLLVFIGIEEADTEEDVIWLSHKIVHLRIFDDGDEIPNISIKDTGGDILAISQFTLYASTKKGNRPSYIKAAKPEIAIPLYDRLISRLAFDLGKEIFTGVFGADMKVDLVNDGPVTILVDTKNRE